MSVFVVDASVGLKWFVPEIHDVDARRLQDPAHTLHVPTLFDVEIGNILWKKIRRGELTRAEADTILAQLPMLPLIRYEELPLLIPAFNVADQTQRTVYDSLYRALAVRLNGRMVAADQRLFNALSVTSWSSHLCWIGDVP